MNSYKTFVTDWLERRGGKCLNRCQPAWHERRWITEVLEEGEERGMDEKEPAFQLVGSFVMFIVKLASFPIHYQLSGKECFYRR
jgi:hypothetical protein